MNKNLQVLVEGAIIAAMAMALSYIPIETGNAGFDLSIGLIPLSVYAVRRGLVPALVVGFVWGLLHIVMGRAYWMNLIQVVFEYPFAFTFGGFVGVFAQKIRNAVKEKRLARIVTFICAASLLGAFARWFWHFWAGIVFWGEFAPDNMSPWLYSLSLNGASFLANAAMMIIVLLALTRVAPILYRTDRL